MGLVFAREAHEQIALNILTFVVDGVGQPMLIVTDEDGVVGHAVDAATLASGNGGHKDDGLGGIDARGGRGAGDGRGIGEATGERARGALD